MSIYPTLVLSKLGLSDRLLLKQTSRLTETSFDAGEVVFHKGVSAYSLCHVVNGFVSASMQAANGEFAPMDIYGQGNWFGELTVFNHHPSALEYTCLTSTRVLLVSHLDAKQAYSSEPRFAKHIGNLVTWRSQPRSEQPTQFQRFVTEATGRSLQPYGAALLKAKEMTSGRPPC